MSRKWKWNGFALVTLTFLCTSCAFPIRFEWTGKKSPTPIVTTTGPVAAPAVVPPIAAPPRYSSQSADLAFTGTAPTQALPITSVTLTDGSVVSWNVAAPSTTVVVQTTIGINSPRTAESVLGTGYRDALTRDATGAVINPTPDRTNALHEIEVAAVVISVLREAATLQNDQLTDEQRAAFVDSFNVQRDAIRRNVTLLLNPAAPAAPATAGPTPSPTTGTSRRPLGFLGNTVLYAGSYPGKTDVSEWDATAGEVTKYFGESNGRQWGIHWSQSNYNGKNTTNGFKFDGTRHRWGIASRVNGASSQADARLFFERRDDDGDSATGSWHEERTANIAGFRLGIDWFNHDRRWLPERNVWAEFRHQLSGDRDATLNKVPQTLSEINYSEKRVGLALDVAHVQWNKQKQRLALGLVGEGSTVREDDSTRALGALRLRYAYRTPTWTQAIVDVQWGKSWNHGVEDTNVLSFNFSLSF